MSRHITNDDLTIGKTIKKKLASLLLFLLAILMGCSSQRNIPTVLPQGTVTENTTTEDASFSTVSQIFFSETTPPDLTLTPSITSTVQVDVVDWQNLPIMPEISDRLFQIYSRGREQGRDPASFSVIGDCQSIPYVFMGPFGRGILQPDNAESYLWDAINHFATSFDRWAVTSRGGFTAASILAPIQADPNQCKPGETPLTCEYRLNNPSFVLITLETWMDPSTIDRYETYLRSILDYVIDHGSIPILLTKADAAEVNEGVHVINPAIARVAVEYEVPLVNFWRAAQYLENVGIDPNRDGFHLSQEGYDLKNILALRALYSVWQAMMIAGTPLDETGSNGSTPTAGAPDGTYLDPVINIPNCQTDCIFFAIAKSQDGIVTPQGVFAYDPLSNVLTTILEEGYDLQDARGDGQMLLVNRDNYLFEINLIDASFRLVTDTLYSLGNQAAYWDSDESEVVFIDTGNPILADSSQAMRLFPSTRDGETLFESGSCSSKDFCQSEGIYRIDEDGTLTLFESYLDPVYSPDGKNIAFLNKDAATKDNYFHIGYLLLEQPDNGIASRRIIYFPHVGGFMIYPDVRTMAFSPDSTRLFIIYDIYSAYFERSVRMQAYLFDLDSGILYDYGTFQGISGSLNPELVWSPKGEEVLFFLTSPDEENGFELSIYQSNLLSGDRFVDFDPRIYSSDQYFYITNIFWP